MTTPNVLDELEWRGLIAHSTDRDALRAALDEGSVKFYVGFDPTAPSLHMGHLVQVLTAKRLQLAGHTPFALVGGATGMIGDPKESGERSLNTLATVKDWVQRVRAQIEPFLSFEGDHAATMVDNYDWTASLSVIDFLRDIGKHFPVNRMLARDVVARRLEDGISYTEFSYVLLQSLDFLELHRQHGVTLQFGGSDQWGNLTAGAELVRRAHGGHVHAFATPLLTKSDGTKYGKTEGGALWLDPAMMSPYAFHQFWLNVEDEKVGELLRIFTFLTREEILELEAETAEKPYLRAGQKRLADEVTALVHGEEEVEHAKAAAAALFGGGDLATLNGATLGAALSEAGSIQVDRDQMPSLVDLLVETGLVKSKGDARRTVSEGGAYLNNERVADAERVPGEDDILAGGWLVLRRGKKSFAGVQVSGGRVPQESQGPHTAR
ncbi:tyrosine--tRNA ligase [Nocardioides seonyuensis]|uniref:Tyrosine--tRNA ligase n=1 Tax=Nocardioides seonyuensis TaxID=2518371 RepID=A0A4P7IH12_9ACTN|nr:tyrosine--tRNA ligase [Nocardioides seonyuensis]QBX56649.1 tyrosine--tRNA ligase [Nocardioides seonyuensis]